MEYAVKTFQFNVIECDADRLPTINVERNLA
jgi:hypothetical protein